MVVVIKKLGEKNNIGEMAERFKAADCKSVELSHRRFESFFLQKLITKYNAAVACLLWEQKVVCSNHTISKKVFKTLLNFFCFEI
jgi:hypothetical protein